MLLTAATVPARAAQCQWGERRRARTVVAAFRQLVEQVRRSGLAARPRQGRPRARLVAVVKAAAERDTGEGWTRARTHAQREGSCWTNACRWRLLASVSV